MIDIASVWPGWEIEELIGQGAYGKVYRIRKEELGEKYYAALKVIRIPADEAEVKTLLSMGYDNLSIRDYFEDTVKKISNEIRTMSDLKSAPNIVHVEEHKLIEHTGSLGWTILIRMELLTSLPDYIRTGGAPDVKQTVRIGKDICAALECCEQKKIIHRDVKPDNIFCTEFGTYKLGDFGIARQMESTKSAYSQKGTTAYMAPEVNRGEKYDSTVDIYSLGIMLYQFLNRQKPPFIPVDSPRITPQMLEEGQWKRLSGQIPPAPVDAPPALAKIILKACHPEPGRRFRSAKQFREALTAFEEGKNPIPDESTDYRAGAYGTGSAGAGAYGAGTAGTGSGPAHWSSPKDRNANPEQGNQGPESGAASQAPKSDDEGQKPGMRGAGTGRSSNTASKSGSSKNKQGSGIGKAAGVIVVLAIVWGAFFIFSMVYRGRRSSGRQSAKQTTAAMNTQTAAKAENTTAAAAGNAVGAEAGAAVEEEYTISVQNGYIFTNDNYVKEERGPQVTAEPGKLYFIEADPNRDGMYFDHWEIISGHTEIDEEMTYDTLHFIMPEESLEFQAVYREWELYPWISVLYGLDELFCYGGKHLLEVTEDDMKAVFAGAGMQAYTRSNGKYFRDYYNDEEWWIADYEHYSYASFRLNVTPGQNPYSELSVRIENLEGDIPENALLPDSCPLRIGDTYEEVIQKIGASAEMGRELIDIGGDDNKSYYHESSPGGYMMKARISNYENEVFDSYSLNLTNKNYEYSFTFDKGSNRLRSMHIQGVLHPQVLEKQDK